ncbi:MAG: hypothetical protein MPW16_01985 [Candidatus Manganitrophus sp.]|nr:MAG: hypothetical protein MPW16_01985 [Candidatus Manganitrophus sp.]
MVARQREAGLETGFNRCLPGRRSKHVGDLVGKFEVRLAAVREEAQKLSGELSLDFVGAFKVQGIDLVSLQTLKERCVVWLAQLDELTRWNNYFYVLAVHGNSA